jgi:hypothetical protein
LVHQKIKMADLTSTELSKRFTVYNFNPSSEEALVIAGYCWYEPKTRRLAYFDTFVCFALKMLAQILKINVIVFDVLNSNGSKEDHDEILKIRRHWTLAQKKSAAELATSILAAAMEEANVKRGKVIYLGDFTRKAAIQIDLGPRMKPLGIQGDTTCLHPSNIDFIPKDDLVMREAWRRLRNIKLNQALSAFTGKEVDCQEITRGLINVDLWGPAEKLSKALLKEAGKPRGLVIHCSTFGFNALEMDQKKLPIKLSEHELEEVVEKACLAGRKARYSFSTLKRKRE